jgi:hypothetical protein
MAVAGGLILGISVGSFLPEYFGTERVLLALIAGLGLGLMTAATVD